MRGFWLVLGILLPKFGDGRVGTIAGAGEIAEGITL